MAWEVHGEGATKMVVSAFLLVCLLDSVGTLSLQDVTCFVKVVAGLMCLFGRSGSWASVA